MKKNITLVLNEEEQKILLRAISGIGINLIEKRWFIGPLIDRLKYCDQCLSNNFKHQCSNIGCYNSYEEIQI